MAGFVETPCRQFSASGALGQYLRVKTPSSLALAGATDNEIGTMEVPALAANDVVAVRLRNAPGTQKFVASEAVSVGDLVHAAASGKVATTGTILIGVALTSASGDGSVIEVLRTQEAGVLSFGTAAVTAAGSVQGDAAALTAGAMNVVAGGDDTKGAILPTAAVGTPAVLVLNSGSAGLKIYPASSDKINNGSANAAITILENTMAFLVPTAADNWAAIYTVNS